MDGGRGTAQRVLVLAVVAVLVAAAGHALGHGQALDLASLLVAALLAAGLGALVARRWTLPRLLLVLALVQPVVHVLGGAGADPRLVQAAAHGHSAHAGTTAALAAPTAMLLWHVLAVPVSALLLVGLLRSAVLVAALLRRRTVARPAVLPALRPALPTDLRPRTVQRLPHLLVSRSNAPPCPA